MNTVKNNADTFCGFIENRITTPGRNWQASTDGSYQWAGGCDLWLFELLVINCQEVFFTILNGCNT